MEKSEIFMQIWHNYFHDFLINVLHGTTIGATAAPTHNALFTTHDC